MATAKEYTITSISELCDIFSGKTANKYVDEGIPILKIRNVTGIGIDWDTDYVEEDFFDENESSHLITNDVLLTCTGEGTIGRVDIFEEIYACIIAADVCVLRVKTPDVILPRYILYYLRSIFGQMQIERYTTGSTGQTHLRDVEKMWIVYPKAVSEQQKIVDALLELEKEASEKERNAIVLLSSIDEILFNKLGFSIDREQQKYYTFHLSESSERLDFIFNNPFYNKYFEELEQQSKHPFAELRDLVTFSSESLDPQKTPDETFQYVDIGNIDSRWGRMESETMAGNDMKSARMRRVIRTGQILVSTTRPTRRAIAIVPEELDGQICSTGFSVLECNEKVIKEYLFHILRSKILTLQFEKYSSGSGYPAVNKNNDMPRISIPCPEEKETQKQIADEIDVIVEKASELHIQAKVKSQKAVELFQEYFQVST